MQPLPNQQIAIRRRLGSLTAAAAVLTLLASPSARTAVLAFQLDAIPSWGTQHAAASTAISQYPALSLRQQIKSIRPTAALHCQLLGMNSAVSSQFALTWPEFCLRGGETDIHADGWGMAYYGNGPGLRQFHDVQAASTSPLAQFLGQQEIETQNLLAHIRYATSGTVVLENVHPFRESKSFRNFHICARCCVCLKTAHVRILLIAKLLPLHLLILFFKDSGP